jgi:hypothetical protein
LASFTIAFPDDLTDPQFDRAVELGPEFADSRPGFHEMMRQAGFANIRVEDVSNDYLAVAKALLEARGAEAEAMGELIGVEELEERQQRMRRAITALQEGVLGRYLITGRRP